jgi:hypothetical protein
MTLSSHQKAESHAPIWPPQVDVMHIPKTATSSMEHALDLYETLLYVAKVHSFGYANAK